MGSLCTCFQGNRGLQNTGRLDFLFSMCCTALWQNTADPSNDSKSPHGWPRCCSAVFDLKLDPCTACTLQLTLLRHTTIHRGGARWLRGSHRSGSMHGSNIRDHLQVTSVSVPPHHHHHHSTPTSPRWNDLLLWSAVSRPPAWLVGGGTGKCLSLWETLALWSHEYIIGGHCAMREVHWDAVQSKDSNRRILINSAS